MDKVFTLFCRGSWLNKEMPEEPFFPKVQSIKAIDRGSLENHGRSDRTIILTDL